MVKSEVMQGSYIQLAVPERHYLEVIQYLARLDADENGDTKEVGIKMTPKGRIKASSRPAKVWTSGDLAQLKHEITTKRKYLAPLFELMAANPGGYVSKADYEEASGFKGHQLRSALAGLTQYIGKNFERSNWPFGWEWNLNGSAETSYIMSIEQAKAWNRA